LTIKAIVLVLAMLLLITGVQAFSRDPTRNGDAARTVRAPDPSGVTLSEHGFTANLGQVANPAVRFYFSTGSMRVGFATDAVLFVAAEGPSGGQDVLVRATFANANRAEPVATGPLPYSTNFLVGRSPAHWRTNVPSYRGVAYEGLYDGIDLAFTGTSSGAKYEFVIAPGADVAAIGIRFEGMMGLRLDPSGNLVIRTTSGDLVDSAPLGDQAGRTVDCGFVLRDAKTVGFRCSGVDPSRELRIDPLIYATFLGSTGVDRASAVATDSSGNAYIAGAAGESDFPTTPGAFDRTFGGGCGFLACADAFVAKLNPSGTGLIYATYLGGSAYDVAYGITVDDLGNAYVTGNTSSNDFPVTGGAFRTTYGGGGDAFIAAISPAGDSLVYSTYLGGSAWDIGYSLAVDSAHTTYVTGETQSSDFPTTLGAYNRTYTTAAAFAAKLSADGKSLVYSTFLGSSYTGGASIAVDASGNAFIAGTTMFSWYPTTPGAYRRALQWADAFVTELNAAGSALTYSTFLGGSAYDYANAIDLDAAGNAFVTGSTNSSDFPVTPGAWNTTFPGASRGGYVYVAELNAAGSGLTYATFIGGTSYSIGNAIAVDSTGDAFVAGLTTSSDFPTTPGAVQPAYAGPPGYSDAFVSELSPSGGGLLASTYLGGTGGEAVMGLALDGGGQVYVSGETSSMDFPVTQGAFDTTPNFNYTTQSLDDGFVAKLSSLVGGLTYKILVDTGPTGLQLEINGTRQTTPHAFWCANGTSVWINATSPQLQGSYQYWFSSWSDGGPEDRSVACVRALTLTAYYTTTPQPDYVLLASPSRANTAPGANATVDLTVLGLNGYVGPIVTLSLAGAPAGVTGTFSPTFVAPSGTATLTLEVSPSVAPGVYPMAIQGRNGTATRAVPFQLEVLGLRVTPGAAAVAIRVGSLGSTTVNVTLEGNFTNPVVLSILGLPAGVGVSFSTAQFFATGTTTLSFIVADNAAVGTYPVTLWAVGSVISRSASLNLQILPGGGTLGGAGDWAALFGWFVGAMVISAAVIYLIERRRR